MNLADGRTVSNLISQVVCSECTIHSSIAPTFLNKSLKVCTLGITFLPWQKEFFLVVSDGQLMQYRHLKGKISPYMVTEILLVHIRYQHRPSGPSLFSFGFMCCSCFIWLLCVKSMKLNYVLQYVDDLVAGLMALMEGEYEQPVNLGNPKKYSIEVWCSCEQNESKLIEPELWKFSLLTWIWMLSLVVQALVNLVTMLTASRSSIEYNPVSMMILWSKGLHLIMAAWTFSQNSVRVTR